MRSSLSNYMAADIPEMSAPLEGCASVAEGPRGLLWCCSNSNNCIDTQFSLLRQEEGLGWSNGGNWKLMTAQTVYSHGQCIRPPLRDPRTLTHVITRVYTQESVSLVAIQNILGRSHICRVWMPTEDACCASQTQRDEFIMVGGNDTELKFSGFDSESYNSFGWLFLKDNRKMQVISVFAKGTVQWSGWDFTHLQKQGPRAEL